MSENAMEALRKAQKVEEAYSIDSRIKEIKEQMKDTSAALKNATAELKNAEKVAYEIKSEIKPEEERKSVRKVPREVPKEITKEAPKEMPYEIILEYEIRPNSDSSTGFKGCMPAAMPEKTRIGDVLKSARYADKDFMKEVCQYFGESTRKMLSIQERIVNALGSQKGYTLNCGGRRIEPSDYVDSLIETDIAYKQGHKRLKPFSIGIGMVRGIEE